MPTDDEELFERLNAKVGLLIGISNAGATINATVLVIELATKMIGGMARQHPEVQPELNAAIEELGGAIAALRRALVFYKTKMELSFRQGDADV